MKKLIVFCFVLSYFSCISQEIMTFKDMRDNKEYKYVGVGNQLWMAENLAYKPDRGVYWALNNDTSYIRKFGYLYDFETAKNSCPAGWYLPTEKEWETLITNLGGNDIASGKLKATEIWKYPNTAATNSSGFNALPGGCFSKDALFLTDYEYCYFWTSTKSKPYIVSIFLCYYAGNMLVSTAYPECGYSVRCVFRKK